MNHNQTHSISLPSSSHPHMTQTHSPASALLKLKPPHFPQSLPLGTLHPSLPQSVSHSPLRFTNHTQIIVE
ncbi:hypothetical protein RIF29_38048 [Crotalaria pallida]|uniref:Uncharacterized protein n=1 Tax=Crotalaria pallida TaxID=3830 RepID=A0AAN9HNJ5_CROPI